VWLIKKYLINIICILLIFVCISNLYGADIDNSLEKRQISVAIWNGTGTYGFYTVDWCISRINEYNNAHSDTKITTTKISKISSVSDLNGFNVLILPGGDHGSTFINNINNDAVRQFVSNGGGAIGICAGAYALAHHTDDAYDGINVAPHVNCLSQSYSGIVKVSMIRGDLLGMSSKEFSMELENGPAMYMNSDGAITLSTYVTGPNVGGISQVLDSYGEGRVILFGPHPENEDLPCPNMLGGSIKYVASEYNDIEYNNIPVENNPISEENLSMDNFTNLSNVNLNYFSLYETGFPLFLVLILSVFGILSWIRK
jgi:glutamine amidotransferase-like uncharacterized protein